MMCFVLVLGINGNPAVLMWPQPHPSWQPRIFDSKAIFIPDACFARVIVALAYAF